MRKTAIHFLLFNLGQLSTHLWHLSNRKKRLAKLLVFASMAFAIAIIGYKTSKRSKRIELPLGPQVAQFESQPIHTYEFNRDIRPILAENCFSCHGPDSASRKADLRLDRRDDAVASGAIVPGKPDESSLIARVCASDESEVMPPPRTKK